MVWTLLLIFLFAGTVCSWCSIMYLINSKWSNVFLTADQRIILIQKNFRVGGVGIIVISLFHTVCFILFDSKDNQSLMHFTLFFGALACFA